MFRPAIAAAFIFAAPAQAAVYHIDLSQLTPSGYAFGPCYCGSGPLFTFSGYQSGDVLNLGHVDLGVSYDEHTPGRSPQYRGQEVSFVYSTQLLWRTDLRDEPERGSGGPLVFEIDYRGFLEVGWDGPATYLPPVPEPATWVMALIGFAGVAGFAWRRR